MDTRTLLLKDIRIDGDTQPRAAISQEAVAEYAEAMQAGAEFPPVEVFHDGAAWWLVDGFHRYHAAHRAGRTEIAAVIKTGVQADAQWASLAANKTHGLHRSTADKAKAVAKALRLKPGLSDHAIAAHVGVDHKTVASHRTVAKMRAAQSRGEIPQVNTITGRDGKTYNVAKIKRRAAGRREFRISPAASMPVQSHSQPDPKQHLDLPRHNPVMAARAIFECFEREYLNEFITELQRLLQPTQPQA